MEEEGEESGGKWKQKRQFFKTSYRDKPITAIKMMM
jgi:hypothetical protein